MRIYTDGGVMGRNPSPLGGMWAFCAVDIRDVLIHGDGHVITPAEVELDYVENNVSELFAVVKALEWAPVGPAFTIWTDSLNTLRRVIDPINARMNGVCDSLHQRLIAAVQRHGGTLPHQRLDVRLCAGHPTKAELDAGRKAKNNLPVSQWNVWCDKRCNDVREIHEAAMRLAVHEKVAAEARGVLQVAEEVLRVAKEEVAPGP